MSPTAIKRVGGLAATAFAVAAAVAPPPAGAAGGATTLALSGPGAQALRAEGVKIRPLKPARGSASRVVLPIAGGLAGSETTLLHHRGGILFSRGKDELRLTSLDLVLGTRSRLTAKLDDRDIDLFRILRGGKRTIDSGGGGLELSGLPLKLTRGAGRAISRAFGLGQIRPRRFGTLAASGTGLTAGGPAPTQAPAAKAAGCPLPASGGPAPEEPLPSATRPPSAADVTAATIDWHVRESFIRYIGTGEGTSVSGGATADPPVLLPGASAALSYDFHFPFAGGWLDTGANPSSPADDTAAIYFSGGLRFHYSAHEIDLTASAPELEIAGGKSRAIFTVAESGKPAQRQVLVNLDLSHAGAVVASGGTYTYERVPGAIPSGTATSVFAGFYSPGTEFGCFTVSFTSP